MIRRVMIDIETLGTKPGCVVLEIGIVCNVSNPYDAHSALADAIAQAAHLDRLGLWRD